MAVRKIEQILASHKEGQSLLHDLERIKIRVTPLLAKIAITFPEFTAHDIGHSERIIEQFDNLFPDSLKEKFNEYELYFFIASIYLHDLGMIKNRDDNKLDSEKLKQIIRDNHHIRSEAYINKNYKELGIDEEHQADIIGRICLGHRKENLYDKNLFRSEKIYLNFPINIPLLGSLLRISDEFDLSFNRVQEISYHNIEFDNSISEEEWITHHSISGIAPSPDDPTLIKGSAKCKSPNIHRKLKNIENKINFQLEELPDHLHHYRELKNELPKKFRVDIESEGYEAYDFKFSLQEREIIRMLMGEKLYQRKEESIRELIKNSVDACRLRKEILNNKQLDLIPTIEFKISSNGDSIEIADNGIGMNKESVESYFTKIGKSFYKSNEFLNQHFKFTPVSELGIGFLSCFMIAEKIIIDTKMEGNQALIIEIDDLSDYFLIRDSSKSDPGTSVSLVLKDDSKAINFFEELRNFVTHLDINISFYNIEGTKTVIKDEGYKNQFIKYLGDYARISSIKEIELSSDYIEGTLGFLHPKTGSNLLVLSPYYYYRGEEFQKFFSSLKNKNITSYDGIFVNNNKSLIPQWLRLDFFNLNIKKDVVDLNVARNDLILNDKYYEFIEKFEKLIINEIKRITSNELKTLNLDDIRKKSILDKFIDQRVNWYEYYTNWIEKGRKPSNNLINLLKENRYYWVVVDSEIEYLNSKEISRLNKKIYNVNRYYDISYLQYIVKNCSSIPKKGICIGYLGYGFGYWNEKKYIFPDAEQVDLYDLLVMEKFRVLKEFLPTSWNIRRFKNYNTGRFFELIHYKYTTLNRDHPFIDLIINNEKFLTPDDKFALEGFFKGIKQDSRKDLNIVLNKQKKILKWFSRKKIISENEFSTYLLKPDDFPPGFLKEKLP